MNASFLKRLWTNYPTWIMFALCLPIFFFEAKTENDFDIFIQASRDWFNGKNPYTELYHEWYHYFYDVTFITVLSWFQFLPNYFIKLGWLILNFFFLASIWRILIDYLNLKRLSEKRLQLFGFVFFLFSLRLLRDNIHLGQMTILILFLIMKGMDLLIKNRLVAGSALISWGIVVKILPVVVIPYLVYRRKFKAAVAVVVFALSFLLLPYLYMERETYFNLLQSRWELLNPSNVEHVLDTSERSFHSLTTLVATLFHEKCEDTHVLKIRRHVADFDVHTVNWISLIVRLLFVSTFLWVLRSRPFVKALSKKHEFAEWAYLCMLIPLIFPHQQHYAFLLALPGFAILLAPYFTGEQELSWKKGRTWLMLFVFLSFNIGFLLGTYSAFYNHFKLLTYGGIVALSMLLVNRNRVSIENSKLE
jgi:hypothetical protein